MATIDIHGEKDTDRRNPTLSLEAQSLKKTDSLLMLLFSTKRMEMIAKTLLKCLDSIRLVNIYLGQ